MNKRDFSWKMPKGFYRRQCKKNPPEDKGMRSIVESVNFVLKKTQITSLRSKKHFMRERELGWQIILYNIKRKIKVSKDKKVQTFIFLEMKIYFIWDNALISNIIFNITL